MSTVDDIAALTRAHALVTEAAALVHEVVDAHPHDITGLVMTALTKLDLDAAAADRDITVVGRYLGFPR
ncbi:MAG TPA: hypothetical protein VGW74_04695 [Propionibacteriaceae bacterium]|nr:hypothetical protein [Propionibacteriaceae bacterium]